MFQVVEKQIGGKTLRLETGEMAKQAHGAVVARYEDVVVLVTAVAAPAVREGIDFFPLTVDYREKFYAAGKIPGGFIKREGRPGEKEILTSRLIDRPLRPLFPKAYRNETQVIATVLSADQQNDPDILAMIGASAALTVSDIPFLGPVGAVRVGRIEGEFVINPTYSELEVSDLELVIAGTKSAIVMVEGGAKEVSEEVMFQALTFGHSVIQEIIDLQCDLQKLAGREKRPLEPETLDTTLENQVRDRATPKIREAIVIPEKLARQQRLQEVFTEIVEALAEEEEEAAPLIQKVYEDIEREELRRLALEEGVRADGRRLNEIRPISIRVGVLPRTHGSALFTRGETQALVVTTLGTTADEQRMDDLEGKTSKTFMLHYNFPPFSVGEVSPLRGPGRREIGHGALAERSLLPVIPPNEEFPYTIRIVSDILESNGSSSMATVCGASLSMMDAGVPIRAPVAGIAMGLIKEGDRFAILSDILGVEDHLGDMDFKVAGTTQGITGFQMDVKINEGISNEIMWQALEQARVGRLLILEKMNEVLTHHRAELSIHAPRIITMRIHTDKIRDVIGPGGKMIRSIIEKTGVSIDISDDGLVSIASPDGQAAQKAINIIKEITAEAEIGKIYVGKVKKIVDFGAFVEILPGTEGLVHISQISDRRVRSVADELREGDEILVKVLDIDPQGRIKLSRKEALKESPGKELPS